MTREEAVKRIKRFLEERNENCDEDEIAICFVTPYDADALHMAIKALEQETCEDAISRSETIKYLNTNMAWYDEDGGMADSDEKLKAITDLINGVPSAQPERTCVNCGRTVNNGGWYADGRTRCPIEEHYALPKDGYCHLWEKRNVTDDDYPERQKNEQV